MTLPPTHSILTMSEYEKILILNNKFIRIIQINVKMKRLKKMENNLLGNNVKTSCRNIIDIISENLSGVSINAIYFRITHLVI